MLQNVARVICESIVYIISQMCTTYDLWRRATGNIEAVAEAAVEADASVAKLIFCTVSYCWKDIPAHVSPLSLVPR